MGKITVVGIGPGNLDEMTPKARRAIEEADTIAGYNTYIKLIEPLLEGKKVIGTGMMQEIDRCRAAAEEAKDKNVAVVSSGDAGVYGMAGLVLEITQAMPKDTRPSVEVAAGVSALSAAAVQASAW